MAFLTPALLAGALFIAVPIALHLVMQRKPQELVFPALRFVKRRRSSNQTRLRLRQLLLLLLRCLAIVLLALALARPMLRGTGLRGAGGGSAAALVFDSSSRMNYRWENQTRLEAAQDVAHWLLDQMPADTQVSVADTARGLLGAASEPTSAKLRVDRLQASAAARDWSAVLRDALDSLGDDQQTRRELYVFTDLSAAAWDGPSQTALAEGLAGRPGVRVYVIDTGAERPINAGLAPLSTGGDTSAVGDAVAVSTTAYRTAAAEPGRRTAELWLEGEGEPEKRGESVIDLTDAEAEVRFSLAGLEEGLHQGYVRLASDDPLADDDVRYFTLRVEPPRQVLVAAPTAEQALFVREAIAPSGAAPGVASRYECRVTTFARLASITLEDYAAVLLLDPPPLEDKQWDALADYAELGGGVGVFLGREARRGAMNAPAPQRLLPAPLRWKSLDATYLRPTSYQHPALSQIADYAESIPWREFPVRAFWALDTPDETAVVAAPFENGDAAILDQAIGAGRVITMTTPVSDLTSSEPWNLLPTGREPWPFLALSGSLIDYLTGAADRPLNYTAGVAPVVAVRPRPEVFPYVLRTPDGAAQRQTLPPDQAEIVVSLADRVGNYRLRAGGDSQQLDAGFSVNVPGSTGALQRVPADGLREALGARRTQVVRTRDELERQVEVGRSGRDLFPWVVTLLALASAIEYVIANRFYSAAPGEED
ncbi:hypothetical protein Pla175_48990 [Pirellulimonas nuda]|uniref:Aerotolerance regulator N-terminal domain-containing protein n=1 Tax=Pirellulimonas nuda TaxID=2528009 RepID=A0A518DJ24_9BACT|nr:BatA domain-containing protein [Pirellulimonas nuda]QDU91470.1 hypothetical protein Pla175_48990 [Pirellulimonas nuda]